MAALRLRKRKMLLNVLRVGVRDKGRLAQITLSLSVFLDQEVALALLPPKDLPGASDLKSLGDGLPCFCFSGCSCHRSAEDSGESKFSNTDFRLGRPVVKMHTMKDLRPVLLAVKRRLMAGIEHVLGLL